MGNYNVEQMFITICNLFLSQDWNSNFCKKSLLTVAMATTRSPIKVPCENEDLPDKENAPDFDKDTLQGELGSTSTSVIVRTISIPQVSRM